MMSCNHLGKSIEMQWELVPLSEEAGGEPGNWNLEVTSVRCECGEAFKFYGAPVGAGTTRAFTSLFGESVSIPCIPVSQEFPKGREINLGVCVDGKPRA